MGMSFSPGTPLTDFVSFSFVRPEMTMVFGLYRDLANLLPTAIYAVLLTWLPFPSVFLATGLAMLLCSGLARWIPRGM